MSQARHVGTETSVLAPVDPVVDVVPLDVAVDPRTITLARKKEIFDSYNARMLSVDGVTSTNIVYGDAHKHVTFASSEGSYIEQERIDVISRLAATARRNGDMQQSSMSLGALNDFSYVDTLDEAADTIASRAVELLNAPYVEPGVYPVVLDPILAGVFCHEAFGHLSESDFVYENDRMKEIMVLGRKFGRKNLNIVDGAAVPGLRGSFKYDDEGTPAKKTDLIREGVLVGRLHSRETAGKMGEPTYGNALAIGAALAALGVGGSGIGIMGNQSTTATDIAALESQIASMKAAAAEEEKRMIALVQSTDEAAADRFRRGRKELDDQIEVLRETVHEMELDRARAGRNP